MMTLLASAQRLPRAVWAAAAAALLLTGLALWVRGEIRAARADGARVQAASDAAQLRAARRAGLVPPAGSQPALALVVRRVPGVEVAAEGLEPAVGDGVAHGRGQGLEEGDVVPAQQHLAEDLVGADQVVQIGL